MDRDYKILDKINDPTDMKDLSSHDLIELSNELREYLLDSISKTGGHLAAGLGAVDITVAMSMIPQTILLYGILAINVIHIKY